MGDEDVLTLKIKKDFKIEGETNTKKSISVRWNML